MGRGRRISPVRFDSEILLSFGKYQGKRMKDVDDGYLQWMIMNLSQSSPWWKAAADALIGREKMQPQRADRFMQCILPESSPWQKAGFDLVAVKGKMKQQRQACSVNTLLSDLKACSMSRDLQWGRRIHVKVIESRQEMNMYVMSAVIRMYAKCGSMVDARRIFDCIQKPDVVCWTALLSGYAENGNGLATLELFSKMKASGCVPDSVSYLAALKACASLVGKRDGGGHAECLKRGRDIHSEIGWDSDIFVRNTLIDMYSKCGSMVEARRVFDSIQKPNVVCWTALLLGYAENGDGLATLELFSRMKASGCTPDSVTYIAALKACTSLAGKRDGSGQGEWLKRGRDIHSEMGRDLGTKVHNTLIDMYAKCGSMVDARSVFDSIQNPDVVSWNVLLLGYAENGDGFIALDLFSKMKTMCGCVPDSVTYVAVLKACACIGALALGRKYHAEISELTAHVVTCLVDFYAKCGSMVEAFDVFDLHSTVRVVPTWNALLAGYGSFGDIYSVFKLFEAMQDQGFQPDAVTFVCVLSCCSHAGLVEKAREYLEAMPLQYGLTPTVMHYTCIVDVLGRGNQLNEAVGVLRKMPCNPDAVTWMTLLGACHKWKNVEIGRCAFQSLVNVDKKNASAYVLMAHIYGCKGMSEEQEKVLETSTRLGAWKLPEEEAYVIDERGTMVKFVAGEENNPEVESKLEELVEGMKEVGYVAESYNSSREVLCGHTERRAVVYGLLTHSDETVRAFKNMRMCDDCHGSIKMISKLCGRVIMVRDASRFHVMVNGSCSCGDYW